MCSARGPGSWWGPGVADSAVPSGHLLSEEPYMVDDASLHSSDLSDHSSDTLMFITTM